MQPMLFDGVSVESSDCDDDTMYSIDLRFSGVTPFALNADGTLPPPLMQMFEILKQELTQLIPDLMTPKELGTDFGLHEIESVAEIQGREDLDQDKIVFRFRHTVTLLLLDRFRPEVKGGGKNAHIDAVTAYESREEVVVAAIKRGAARIAALYEPAAA